MKNVNIDLQEFRDWQYVKEDENDVSPILTKNNKQFLKINEPNSFGTVEFEKFSSSISLVNIELQVSEPQKVTLSSGKNQPLSFIYCQEGNVDLEYSHIQSAQRLSRFHTTIVSGDQNTRIKLDLHPGETCKLTILSIEFNPSAQHTDCSICSNLKQLISEGDANKAVFHVSGRNLKTAWAIKDFENIDGQGIAKKLKMEGRIRILLGMEYQQYLEDLEGNDQTACTLTNTEMLKVTKATELINKDPQRDFSVAALSSEVLLSAAKLQEGFKALHDRTVADYIRNVRLEEAEHLLKTTDFNISEVVYSVGFLSRSYFSKIFKTKYRCSPKEYKTEMRLQMG